VKFFGETSAGDWRQPSVIALLLANSVPLFGVLFLHWEVFPLLLLFWFENVILGALNVLKMFFASPENPIGWAAKVLIIPFFCVHYGMFTFVHGVFVVGLFGGGFKRGAGFPNAETFWWAAQESRLGWPSATPSHSPQTILAVRNIGRRVCPRSCNSLTAAL
jgi:hypothetical protein